MASTCSVTVWPAVRFVGSLYERFCVVEGRFTVRVSTVAAAPVSVNTTVVTTTSSAAMAVTARVAPARTCVSPTPPVVFVTVKLGGVSRRKWRAAAVEDVEFPAASVAVAWNVVSREAARSRGTRYEKG